MSALHQASCVGIGGRGVLIEGAPGSGKSSLALALIDRGAQLVGDDGIALARRDDRLFASPAPAIAGLIEVRNVGLVEMPCTADVPVALVIVLDPEAPRFIDAAEPCERGGAALPLVRLWPESPVLPLRAELALEKYGLG
ncbi:HPr kinase/phosphorylase [Novosphingobium sp. TH158]|uniref:HPr kinase/phosphorylase n=1 Tax=Novosphingobium sp. TH158 TaxID=2067455 RepID=UPI000C7E2B35|nr:HPr kinase/phosphatase C-terminal domain-containing protein [Novosphingobium sp. TH158]PLK25558.1 serine kinase [Novosphingobium sp. TH158]